ncbi:MAG TPA: transcriptional regulator [Acidobacteriota bacterium]|nr:transcriptional regulator [Acidobacteriota bacterium]
MTALTRDFRETILERAQSDAAFRIELLRQGVEALLRGDVEEGKSVLRDYINATIGFIELGERTGRSSKSLMRMFSNRGNPHMRHLFQIMKILQEWEGIRLEVMASSAA